LPLIPALNAVYYPVKYIVDNKTFKGVGQDFKKNYWQGTKKSLFYLGIPDAMAVGASVAYPVLMPYLFPILAGFEVAFRIVLSTEKLNCSKLLNPMTYVPNFLNPVYVEIGSASAIGKGVRNTANGLGESVRAIYNGVSSTLAAEAKATPPAKAIPEQAHAP
jgi:hypothetical protein